MKPIRLYTLYFLFNCLFAWLSPAQHVDILLENNELLLKNLTIVDVITLTKLPDRHVYIRNGLMCPDDWSSKKYGSLFMDRKILETEHLGQHLQAMKEVSRTILSPMRKVLLFIFLIIIFIYVYENFINSVKRKP